MSQKLLTTDELLKQLYSPDQGLQMEAHKHRKKKNKQKYLLWGIVAIAVLHLLFLALPLIIGVHQTINITGSARVIAIPYVEGNVTERPGKVSVIKKYQLSENSKGDFVMIYGLLDTKYYWEVEITSIDMVSETITASYDGFSEETYQFDDVDGTYVRETNFLGTLMYIVSQWRGFLFTTGIYTTIILIYYFMVYREVKVIERKKVNETKEKNN